MQSSNLPMSKEIAQIKRTSRLARAVVALNLNGKHMAYQRSTEITVSVRTDTEIDTVCK